MCAVLLPPDGYPIAMNKYINLSSYIKDVKLLNIFQKSDELLEQRIRFLFMVNFSFFLSQQEVYNR